MARDKNGKFIKGASGNPAGRPAKADSLRKLLEGSAEEISRKVIEAAQGGDMRAAELILQRCVAPIRPAHQPVTFALDRDKPLADQGRDVLAAVAAGHLPPDQGKALLDAIAALVRVVEVEEIERRLQTIEEAGNAS